MCNAFTGPSQEKEVSRPQTPHRVLVVDDEPHIREAVNEILGLAGIEVLEAADGASGVRRFIEHRPAIGLIVLDLSMPGISGEETLSALRAVDNQIPIVITSGRCQQDLSAEVDAMASDFLQKPFAMQALLDMMERYL